MITSHISYSSGGVLYSQAKMNKKCIYSAHICCLTSVNGFLAWIQRFYYKKLFVQKMY